MKKRISTRRCTRKLYSKKFGQKGMPSLSKVLQRFKIGEYVDCIVDPSVMKSMPNKVFHGKTGVVYNANPRTYGVIFKRRIRERIIECPVHVSVEHLRKSKCNEEFKKRAEAYEKLAVESKGKGIKISPPKRACKGPKPAFVLMKEKNTPIEIAEKPYMPIF